LVENPQLPQDARSTEYKKKMQFEICGFETLKTPTAIFRLTTSYSLVSGYPRAEITHCVGEISYLRSEKLKFSLSTP
jgi:hypothetical protein